MKDRKTIFSPCRKYRYALWRDWGSLPSLFDQPNETYLMVIGLNPSVADETKDDPTIRRCVDFAKRWGFGALCMTNLFAWRDTKPENMKKAEDPIGLDNDRCLIQHGKAAGVVLAAWGKEGRYKSRSAVIAGLMAANGVNLVCLAYNEDGSPMHPLYCPKDSPRLPWPKPQ